MTNYKKNFYLLLLISFGACLALGWYAYDRTLEVATKELQLIAVNDTVTVYKTKDGKNAAYIRILVGSKKEVLQVLAQKNQRIAALVKATPGIRTVTEFKTVTVTDTTVRVDTLRLPTESKPLYVAKDIDNEHYTARVVLNGDSLSLGVKTYNNFDFFTRDKPNGFLKPTSYIIGVINNNPNTLTTGLQSYEFTPKSKTGLKVSIGVIAGIAAVLLLK